MKQRTDMVVMYSRLRDDLKRRSELNRPSLIPGMNMIKSKPASKKWRVKKFTVRISRNRRIGIWVRRYKTSDEWRAKQPRHIAFHPKLIPIKEIIIRRQRPTAKKAKTKRLALVFSKFAHLYWVLILLGVGGAIFFGVQANQPPSIDAVKPFEVPIVDAAPDKNVSIVPRVQGLPKSEPTHVKMPTVGIDSPIMAVGKAADGTMETPPLFEHTTGWYKLGPSPGEVGPAIIVGHIDTYKGPSVFWNLRNLKPGDIVEISRQDGQLVKFKVTSLKQVDQSNFPTQEVYGNIDYPGLRLITCGGAFNKKTGHYMENTVVFASRV